VLSFQEYISEPANERLRWQIARNMAISGATIDDALAFLPSQLDEGFFRRLGAAWKAFWNPDQESYTREEVEAYLAQQTKAIQGQLQAMLSELSKGGADKAAIQRMLEKMNAHFGGIADTLDHGAEVDKAMAARSGGGEAVSDLPADPRQAVDALQKLPGVQKSDALDKWWSMLPNAEKVKIHALLGIKYPVADVQGRLLRKPLEDARAAGKI
jgi:hypothetical protein